MARAYPNPDISDLAQEPQPVEWQALRGELVALLDQVEGRYSHIEQSEPAFTGITNRVRNLRDQVVRPEPAMRRREALQTVKRAVDRFTEREEVDNGHDALSSAIAEIRSRQMSAPAAALGRRATDMPEFHQLNALVSGLSGRLERLEGELKSQRASNGSVSEVASQVEQLTHVVELLAGAVGETGQVKRLEAQIGALAALIEEGPRVDLSAINRRLDDVSATVGKLAELQAQQMEREISRQEAGVGSADSVAPAMQAIEDSVRNVYDRIDSIEKNVALSSGDFERLTAEMAAFTKAMKDREAAPGKLMAKVDALAMRIDDFDASNGDVVGLKQDIATLRDAVLSGMEPRFLRIESQIEALSGRMSPAGDTAQVESQLRQLIQRMDEAGSQLDGLTRLYSAQSDAADIEAMATMVAERTSDAVARKAPAPVAMFGADSLKSIEERLTGLIKSAGKTPDYEALAELVAERASEAFARTSQPASTGGFSDESLDALEERMTALFKTAGKDTAERLTRLEAFLSGQQPDRAERPVAPRAAAPLLSPEDKSAEERARFDAMLTALSGPRSAARSDAMPANPADEAPLVDPGFKNNGPVRAALDAAALDARAAIRSTAAASDRPATPPAFDPASAERPPAPKSSFAKNDPDPFTPPPQPQPVAPPGEAQPSQSSTSTFVAAARRAQRARQEAAAAPAAANGANSLIARALSRVRPGQSGDDVAVPEVREKKPAKNKKSASMLAAETAPAFGPDAEEAVAQPSFLVRHRRPLLLAGALVVVSMLALNLVIQRSAPEPAQPAQAAPEPLSTDPVSEDVSFVAPEPRVIDMIDSSATGSINPGSAMSFKRTPVTTPMPATLLATAIDAPSADLPTDAPLVVAPEITGSIPLAQSATPETFDLPPESIGPIELRQAAADGDARAQFEIGAIYAEGRAVPKDPAEAAKWYERAAAQGFVPAQYRLGNLYEAGQGVDKDIEIAKLWYQRGAEAGNRMAMHNLAALYAGGMLGEQEFETAAEWFAQAASRGMTDSQFNLGMLYARGLGVQQDFEQSYKWFSLAARSGDKDATQARDDIAKSLSAEAVSRIGNELAAWKSEPLNLAANFAPMGTWSPSFDAGEPITTKDVVARVQAALGRLGFDVGAPDGVAGPKTGEAIKAFERSTGMSETGAINPRLLAVLGSQPV